MVHAAQIAALGYSGCKSVQSVTNFCKKNKTAINCVWWTTNNQKILLVDPQSFKQTYKQIHGIGTSTGRTTTTSSYSSSKTGRSRRIKHR
jgi:hypothetical protein